MKKFQSLYDSGALVKKYPGIIEIFPRKATNSFVFEAALTQLSKTHNIIQLFPGRLRAFEKK